MQVMGQEPGRESEMKIYTCTGDRGMTSLIGGDRISKSDVRVCAYGEMDELNSSIGYLASLVDRVEGKGVASQGDWIQIVDDLMGLQGLLMDASVWIASDPCTGAHEKFDPFCREAVKWLESRIDNLSESLPPLESFVVPGGSEQASWAQVIRCKCRRTERTLVEMIDIAGSPDREPWDSKYTENVMEVLTFLNRLSDYFFVLARWVNLALGKSEAIWVRQREMKF